VVHSFVILCHLLHPVVHLLLRLAVAAVIVVVFIVDVVVPLFLLLLILLLLLLIHLLDCYPLKPDFESMSATRISLMASLSIFIIFVATFNAVYNCLTYEDSCRNLMS